MTDERAKQIIDVWKVIVEVQQHFNDISMRIRTTFITVLIALFASIGFLLEKNYKLALYGIRIQFVVLIPLIGIVGTLLFYFLDRYWYHRLLVGAVQHAIEIEKTHAVELPELSLSAAIGRESPLKPAGWRWWFVRPFVCHRKSVEGKQLHSDAKIELFYKTIMVLLFFVFVFLVMADGGSEVNSDRAAKMVQPPSQHVDGQK